MKTTIKDFLNEYREEHPRDYQRDVVSPYVSHYDKLVKDKGEKFVIGLANAYNKVKHAFNKHIDTAKDLLDELLAHNGIQLVNFMDYYFPHLKESVKYNNVGILNEDVSKLKLKYGMKGSDRFNIRDNSGIVKHDIDFTEVNSYLNTIESKNIRSYTIQDITVDRYMNASEFPIYAIEDETDALSDTAKLTPGLYFDDNRGIYILAEVIDLANDRGMDLPHYKSSFHAKDGKDIDSDDYDFDYQEAEDYLQEFCPVGYTCGFHDGDWGVWPDESVQESTENDIFKDYLDSLGSDNNDDVQDDEVTDKQYLDIIMRAIYNHTLKLRGGNKTWKGYTLDIQELVWVRNMQDGWEIDVSNSDGYIGSINIDNNMKKVTYKCAGEDNTYPLDDY